MLQCIYLFPRATKLLQRRHKAHEIFEARRVFALIGKAKRDVCALDVFKYHLLADRKKSSMKLKVQFAARGESGERKLQSNIFISYERVCSFKQNGHLC